MSKSCPVCATKTDIKLDPTPYWVCGGCSLWFQDPLPAKTYEAFHELNEAGESTGHLMTDYEKKVNADLAQLVSDLYLKDKKAKTLDIGSKYPYLAHCFKNLGHDAYGMDNIEVVPEYSKDLGVPMLMADFEATSEETLREWTHTAKFDLITMIHVFEHMYNPLECLRKLRRLIADDGRVLIRLPDHAVPGYERDLTPGHYTIHPFFHAVGSITELLVQAENLFTIERYSPMHGAGQADYILKPITKKPQIWAGMIVKNEEKHLPLCLESVKSVIDGAYIVDTGSTDNTMEVAKKAFENIDATLVWESYTGASELEDGDWKLWDFAKARNRYVKAIEETTDADYLFWLDADDQLDPSSVRSVRRATYLDEYDVFGLMIESGGPLWVHHRLWKTGRGIEYDFPIHEYPKLDNKKGLKLSDVIIHHDAAPTGGETSNSRNMRILMRDWDNNPNTRTAFYIANTFSDGGHYEEAVDWYQKRIELADGYFEELIFAYLFKARCERALKRYADAQSTLLRGLSRANNWSELWAELCFIAFEQQKWWETIGYALVAISYPPSETQLWREHNKYTDQPMRMISFAYENLGDNESAKKWAIEAKKFIKGEDKDWDARIAKFDSKKIALLRPGAIGDVVMTLQLVPLLKKKYPGHAIHYFTDPQLGNELLFLMAKTGVDALVSFKDWDKVSNQYDKAFNLIGYPIKEGYPDKPMSQHLINGFAKDMGLDLPISFYPHIEFKPEPIVKEKYITIHPKAGWSMYKNWPFERWEEVIKAFPKYKFIQIGAPTDPKIPGADHSWMGKQLIYTAVLMQHASLHVGVDSFTNHLTGFNWNGHIIPAVILWGSTQASAAGYPMNYNISLGLDCQPCFKEDPKISKQPRGVCDNPPNQTYENPQHKCMHDITVDMVVEAMRKRLSGTVPNKLIPIKVDYRK